MPASSYARRGGRIYVNDEHPDKRWSFDVRGNDEAMHYLLYLCPTTKDAMAKLADMRRAIRSLAGKPGGTDDPK